ncbi:putative fibronectin-binding protein [Peptostreptococcaceae bacterium oral taxon 113 str. W5053]|nr:putative fibronectin-binding protein [Peptostreptococcaceae bacterium oral taxon 113 str. W5053]
MSYDGIVMHAMVNQLNKKFQGAKIQKILHPRKDEIHLHLYHKGKQHHILLSASGVGGSLYEIDYKATQEHEPDAFCMYLRKHLQGGTIEKITQNKMDRVVIFHVSTINELGNRKNKCLILEIMGKHSNIILTNEGQNVVLISLIRVSKLMSRVREVYPGSPYFFIPDNKINILQDFNFLDVLNSAPQHLNLRKFIYMTFSGFSPLISSEIAYRANLDENRLLSDLNEKEKENYQTVFLNICEKIKYSQWTFTIFLNPQNVPIDFHVLNLTYFGEHKKVFSNVSTMLQNYFSRSQIKDQLKDKIIALNKNILKLLEKDYNKLSVYEKDLSETKEREHHKILADLISANQHLISKGQECIEVINFYSPNSELLKISLDPTRSAWVNAQHHYKKYAKLKTAEKLLTDKIPELKRNIEYLKQVLYTIKSINTQKELDEILNELYEQNIIKEKRKLKKSNEKEMSSPLEFTSSEGLHILVGKNNRQNDFITMKIAKKGDLFFHIKNLPGPHVILKTQDRTYTEKSIEEAAMLAAYYSHHDLDVFSIDYTFKKNVKKPKSSKPGMVYYDNQKTIFTRINENLLHNIIENHENKPVKKESH